MPRQIWEIHDDIEKAEQAIAVATRDPDPGKFNDAISWLAKVKRELARAKNACQVNYRTASQGKRRR